MFAWSYDSPRRGKGHRGRPFGEFDGCIGGWDIEGEPYTVAPDSRFMWFRARMLGGRTNHWGRISLRFGPWDFKARSRDGLGDDWPIGYDDVKPYYDRLDRMVGIFGTNEGLENEPDGVFMPPPQPRCYEVAIQKACERPRHPGDPVAPLDPDAAARREARLPLLQPVRPRLLDRVELLDAVRAAAARRSRRAS